MVDADRKSSCDTLPHDRLREQGGTKISDGRVRTLIAAGLKPGVMDPGKHWPPEAGTPPGGVLSPLWANISLDPVDHARARAGCERVRAAEDVVIVGRSAAEAQRALTQVRQWTTPAGLPRHPAQTRGVNAPHKGGCDAAGTTVSAAVAGRARRAPRSSKRRCGPRPHARTGTVAKRSFATSTAR